jgi:hypothetical protein
MEETGITSTVGRNEMEIIMDNAMAIFDCPGEQMSAIVERMNKHYGSCNSYSTRTVPGTEKTEVVGYYQSVMILIGYAVDEGAFLISYTAL